MVYHREEMRTSIIQRKTKETNIEIKLNIDGKGISKIDIGIKFFEHMLELLARHGLFDLTIKAKGDLEVDQHHTVEDVGIALGDAFDKALGSKKGINRAGYFVFPMDDSLAIVALDIAGRPYLRFWASFKREKIGDMDSELIHDFFEGFVNHLKANLHIRSIDGRTDHHKAEAIFKAVGKALKFACSRDKRALRELPSTKGLI